MRRLRARAVAGSLALPVLFLAALAGQAEWSVRDSTVIRVAITGYDPRDALRGHYVRYRFAWNWQGGKPDAPVAALCVLSRGPGNPPVRALLPGDAGCGLPIRLAVGQDPAFTPAGLSDELFIPEARAQAVQAALAAHPGQVTVDLAVDTGGTARIKGWHIDGEAAGEWRPPGR